MTRDHEIDRVLRDHAEAAEAAAPAPSWDRLEGRLAEGAPLALAGEHQRRDRRPLLVAAAVVLVVGGVVGGIWRQGDDGAPVHTRPAEEGTTTTAPMPTTSAAPTSGTEGTTADPDGPSTTAPPTSADDPMPATVLVLRDDDGDGVADLVRLDGIGGPQGIEGVTATVLVAGMPPDPEAPGVGGQGPYAVDVFDGRAYVETCCEPAVGQIEGFDIASGDQFGDGTLVFGTRPAISASGVLAYSTLNEVRIVPLVGPGGEPMVGASQSLGPSVEIEGTRYVTDLAWSPDGRRLARSTLDYEGLGSSRSRVEVFDLDRPDDGWQGVTADGGRGLAHPAFLADGRLAVGTDPTFNAGGITSHGLAVVDLDSGDLSPRQGLLEIVDLDATVDGRWIIAIADGALRAYSGLDLEDQGTVATSDGYLSGAGW